MHRDTKAAEALYKKIPASVRGNEEDLSWFLHRRDASHLKAHGSQVCA
jgi:hypothetical protein